MSELTRSYKPKFIRQDYSEVVDKDVTWNAGECHSYMMQNEGNTICTIFGVKVLMPGEFFTSDEADPYIINKSQIRIEFDRKTAIYSQAMLPGADPLLPNDPFDPNNPRPADNRLLIFKSYLKPYES